MRKKQREREKERELKLKGREASDVEKGEAQEKMTRREGGWARRRVLRYRLRVID